MLSYCDHLMSVLCCASCVVNNCFKGHLLNYWLDFDQTWQKKTLYGPVSKLFTELTCRTYDSVTQTPGQGHTSRSCDLPFN